MRLVRTIAATDATMTSNVPEAMPAAWSNATTYAVGDSVALITGTVGEVYESRVAANLNHNPAVSPTEWRHVATVYAAWSAATTYAAGVFVTRNHKVWKSLAAGNLNNTPETSPNSWQDRGATNRWAAFDAKTGSQCSRYGPLTITLTPAGRVDTIGLLNVNAASATVVMTAGGDEVFNETFSLVSRSGITDMWRWLFWPIVRQRDLVVTGLPNYASPTITITLNGDEVVSIGELPFGLARRIGWTDWGSKNRITDYSTKEADVQGNWYLLERAFSKAGSLTVEVPAADHDAISELLSEYRARPTLWLGSDIYRSHNFFGVPKDWDLTARDVKTSILQLNYEAV